MRQRAKPLGIIIGWPGQQVRSNRVRPPDQLALTPGGIQPLFACQDCTFCRSVHRAGVCNFFHVEPARQAVRYCENPVRPNRRGFPFWVQSSFELRPHLPPREGAGSCSAPSRSAVLPHLRRQSHPRDPPQGYAQFQRTMAKKCLRTRLSSVCALRHHTIHRRPADLQFPRDLCRTQA